MLAVPAHPKKVIAKDREVSARELDEWFPELTCLLFNAGDLLPSLEDPVVFFLFSENWGRGAPCSRESDVGPEGSPSESPPKIAYGLVNTSHGYGIPQCMCVLLIC